MGRGHGCWLLSYRRRAASGESGCLFLFFFACFFLPAGAGGGVILVPTDSVVFGWLGMCLGMSAGVLFGRLAGRRCGRLASCILIANIACCHMCFADGCINISRSHFHIFDPPCARVPEFGCTEVPRWPNCPVRSSSSGGWTLWGSGGQALFIRTLFRRPFGQRFPSFCWKRYSQIEALAKRWS